MVDDCANPLEKKIKNFCAVAGPYFFFFLLCVGLLEVGSFITLQLYGSLHINDGRNPTQYSDEQLQRLYPSWKPAVARAMLEEVWLNRPRHYEPLVEYSEAPYKPYWLSCSL